MNRTQAPWTCPLSVVAIAVFLMVPSWSWPADQASESAAAITRIMETFARPPVDSGAAVGIAVGVTYRGRAPQFFSYGTASVLDGTAVTPDTIFEMGSVTKVFTTALLGEAVLAGDLKLNLPLSRLERLVGPMQRSTQKVTLLNLGDFTAGLTADTPPECPPPPMPLTGCMPSRRPTIGEYGAQDLLDYFRTFSAPPMPGLYFYSDISTGLVGLILGSNPNAPMGDDAVQGWLDLVRNRITEPLGMTDTFLFDEDASPSQQARLADGYDQPSVDATASGGGLVIVGWNGGTGYSTAPVATVTGGGGSGAEVAVAVGGGSIAQIEIKHPGQGYIAPPEVVFGGVVATPAKGRAVISNGQVIGISVQSRGEGYSPKSPPTVALIGGTSGPDARTAILAPANVSNGGVDFVRVIDGGAGYVDPIAVVVPPGSAAVNAVPVWAPAGALKSSARDMLFFAEAALGRSVVNGMKLDPRLKSAFKMAQKGHVCETAGQRPCRAQSGLTWSISPADGGMPAVVSKNGGLAGFSTDLRLVPSLDLGIIVFINSNRNEGTPNGKKPVSASTEIADNIMNAIARSNLR